jgi:polysaccharide export outer membrane protein
MYNTIMRRSAVVLALALALTSQLAAAQTAAQLQMLKQLPPSQRDALIKQYKSKEAAAGPVEQQPDSGEPLETQRKPLVIKDERKERVVEAGTAMMMDITRHSVAGDGETATTSVQSTRYLVVDAKGEVDIAPVGRIKLLGYTADEVVARLRAEPVFASDSISLRLLPRDPATEGALLPFGYNVFRSSSTSFAPANNIPVPADYVLGPGDTVEVLLYGKDNDQWSLPVTRDGTLEVPMLGPISVVGMRFEDLRTELTHRIKGQMIGVTPSITMGPLRSIRVFVTGDVANPGAYTVSSLATMTHALIASGGPTLVGSLRNIQLKRAGQTLGVLDLYSLLLRGDSSGDRRLQPGDTIFVPAVGPSVTVAGRVRRPAIYELKGERTLESVVAMAGGREDDGDANTVQIERINQKGERLLLDVSLATHNDATERIESGDVIRVQPVLDRLDQVVRLAGHFERAGTQQWREGMHLLDLIPDASVFKPRPDLSYILVVRETGPDRRKSVLTANYLAAVQDPASAQNLEIQPRDEIRAFGLEEDRATAIRPLIESLKNQSRAGDLQRVVTITGQVAHPGDYPLETGMHVSDLLRAAGQLSQSAYTLEAELTRYHVGAKNGDLIQKRIEVDIAGVLSAKAGSDLALQPLDILQIRITPDWSKNKTVKISGEVRFPGEYVVSKTETLGELIERAGGFTEQAYLKGAVFLREELRKKEQEQLNQLARRLQTDLATQSLTAKKDSALGLGQAQQLLAQLQATKAAGRLAIRLDELEVGSDEDLTLKDGDQLYVPNTPVSVTLIGEVNSPTSLRWKPDWDKADYIARAGGLTQNADTSRVFVVKANGEVEASKSRFWFNDNSIEPGDTIVAPLDTDPIKFLDVATSVTQVIYQLAISIAAFRSIGTL